MGKKELVISSNNKKNDLQDRVFSLTRVKTGHGIKISFPKIMGSNLKVSTAIPKFRRDNLPYTDAFSLPDEFHKAIEENSWDKFKEKLSKAEESSHTRAVIPKQKNNYCQVCKERYSGYEFHINQEQHLEKQLSSPFNEYINQLTEVYLTINEMKRLHISSQSEQKLEKGDEESTAGRSSIQPESFRMRDEREE